MIHCSLVALLSAPEQTWTLDKIEKWTKSNKLKSWTNLEMVSTDFSLTFFAIDVI